MVKVFEWKFTISKINSTFFIQVCKLFRNLSSNCLFVNVTYKLLLKTNFQLRSFKGAHFQIKSWNLLRCTQDINCKGSKNTNEETKCVLNDENMPCHWQYNCEMLEWVTKTTNIFNCCEPPISYNRARRVCIFIAVKVRWASWNEKLWIHLAWCKHAFLVMIDARLAKTFI